MTAETGLPELLDNAAREPIISVGEVYERAFASANPRAHLVGFRHFLSAYRLLGLDEPTMERFAETWALLCKRPGTRGF